MFCEHYFLPQAKNIGSTEIFPYISFSRLLFHLIALLLKGFLVLSDPLKPAFEKSSKENSKQISKKNQIISAYRIEVFG